MPVIKAFPDQGGNNFGSALGADGHGQVDHVSTPITIGSVFLN
jgi:hypothetical protein